MQVIMLLQWIAEEKMFEFVVNPWVLRKNLCKFNNSDKKRYCERLEEQPLNFLQY